jgi:hypothetical protein
MIAGGIKHICIYKPKGKYITDKALEAEEEVR